MSFNYKSIQLLTGNRTTQFKVITGNLEKRYLLTRDPQYYGLLNMNKSHEIYSLIPSKEKNIPEFIDEGMNPQLHLGEDWMSYFKSSKNKLIIKKLSFPQKTIEVKIHIDRADAFFVPEAALLAPNKYLYTDMNKNGEIAIVLVENKTPKVIKKFSSIHNRIQFCENKEKLFIGSFNSSKKSPSSIIYTFTKKDFSSIKKEQIIYQSTKNDIGHINCQFDANKIFFLKNFAVGKFPVSELVSLTPKDKKITQLTESKYTNSFFHFGNRMFVMINGEQRLIIGKATLLDDAIPTKEVGSSQKEKK